MEIQSMDRYVQTSDTKFKRYLFFHRYRFFFFDLNAPTSAFSYFFQHDLRPIDLAGPYSALPLNLRLDPLAPHFRLDRLHPARTEPFLPHPAFPTSAPPRRSRLTDRLPQSDQQAIDLMPSLSRQPSLQGQPGLFRRFGLVPAEEISDPVNVHVHPNSFRHPPCCRHAEMRHFRTDAGKGHELRRRGRNVIVVLGVQDDGGSFDIAGLVIVEANGMDELIEGRRFRGKDVLERQPGFCGGLMRRQRGLEIMDGDGGGGVFSLRGKHERDQGLKSLILRTEERCLS